MPIRNSKRVGRNDPCPCGSGKKYKKCCLNLHQAPKPRYNPTPEEQRRGRLALHKLQMMVGAAASSVSVYVQDDVENIEQGRESVANALASAGIPAAEIYAYRKTGLLLHGASKAMHPAADVAAWDAAVTEYKQAHPEEHTDEVSDTTVIVARATSAGDDGGIRTDDPGCSDGAGR